MQLISTSATHIPPAKSQLTSTIAAIRVANLAFALFQMLLLYT